MMAYVCLLAMTFTGALASLFLKKASGADGFIAMLKKPFLYIGGLLYLASALVNIVVLRYLEYSVVLPLTSITYIWTMLFSYFVLQEKITAKKIAGIVLIIAGAVCVSL